MGLGLVGVIPNFVFLAILFLVTRYALRLVRLFFDNIAAGTVRLRDFDREWAGPTYKLVRLLVIAFALVVAYPYMPGSDTDAFKGVSLFIGVVFSLGSSSLIGNIISGLQHDLPADVPGRRQREDRRARRRGHEMRLLVTHLRTPKNEEVIVPNSAIISDGGRELQLDGAGARPHPAHDRGHRLRNAVAAGRGMLIEAAAARRACCASRRRSCSRRRSASSA